MANLMHMVDGELLAMTDEEQAEFVALQATAQNEQSTQAIINQAQTALDESDMVATRCFKAGVQFPAEWQTYVTALRAIIRNKSGTIPTRPAYPANT